MKEIHSIFLGLFLDLMTPSTAEAAQSLEAIVDSVYDSFWDNYPDNVEVFKFDLKDYLLDWMSEDEIPTVIEKVMADISEELTPLLVAA